METKVGSSTEKVTSSFESNISETPKSSKNQAKDIEEPNTETSTEPEEVGEYEELYNEVYMNKTKNFDDDYDYEEGIEYYNDDDDEAAAYGELGTKNPYEYDDDQFKNTTEEQPGANTSTKETTEFGIVIGTVQNESEEETTSAKNPEKETTATPRLLTASSSVPVLSSKSYSSSTVDTLSMTDLSLETPSAPGLTSQSSEISDISSELSTLKSATSENVTTLEIDAKTILEECTPYSLPETSTQLGSSVKGSSGLEETSTKHETSILTEITFGFRYDSFQILSSNCSHFNGNIFLSSPLLQSIL